MPADAAERARALALEDWADESLYFYEMTARFGEADFDRNLPKLLPDAALREAMGGMLKEMLKQTTLAQGTGRRPAAELASDIERLFGAIENMQAPTGFVVGSSLTLADVAIVCQAECIADSTVGRRVLERRPGLAKYFERVDQLTSADRV